MASKTSDRLAKLKERREKLDAEMNALEQKERTEQRKIDTRRKIIVGGALLAHLADDKDFARAASAILNRLVTRDADRAAIADLLGVSSPPDASPASVDPAPAPATSEPPAAPQGETGSDGSGVFPPEFRSYRSLLGGEKA